MVQFQFQYETLNILLKTSVTYIFTSFYQPETIVHVAFITYFRLCHMS